MMNSAYFIWGFMVVTILWIGVYIGERIGWDEEDWGRLSLKELFYLDALCWFWLLVTAVAGWATWASS